MEDKPEKVAFLEYWMKYGVQPSWEKVATSIEICFPSHLELAHSLRKTYLPDMELENLSSMKQKPRMSLSCIQNMIIKKDISNNLFQTLCVLLNTVSLANLDSKSAIEVTKEIQDWYALGWFLGISNEELAKTENAYLETSKRKEVVLNHWINAHKQNASWAMLGEAIQNMSQHQKLSQRILTSCITMEEGTLHSCNLQLLT